MAAQITPELPNAVRLDTKVVLVDRIIDAASNTFRVRAELPNANAAVPSGLRCRAEMAGVAEAVVPAAAAAPRADAAPRRQQTALRMDTRIPGSTPN
jgi:multidrug efflux pump subunit AcrA (membrane-fusion protein)